MLFMVIETYKDKKAVYERLAEKGRMMPEGVSYVNSWVSMDGMTCYQLNESKNEALLAEWAANWADLVDFTFVPVIGSHDMQEKMKESK